MVHGNGSFPGNFSAHNNAVCVPIKLRHSAMVTYEMKWRRGDGAAFHQNSQRGLAVERVGASEPNKALVARNPEVGRVGVFLVGLEGVTPRARERHASGVSFTHQKT